MSHRKVKQKKGQKQKREQQQNKSNMPLMIAALAVVCAVVIALAMTKDRNASEADTELSGAAPGKTDTPASDDVQVIAAGGSLVIPVSEITETASFYPIEVDGTEMEVIAIKASDGSIRTAFNTCQICYGSGRGYYVQAGNYLVCQNCGNRFTADQVEVSSGGCNPYPIFSQNKTVTGDLIEISYDFLQAAEKIFANWKR